MKRELIAASIAFVSLAVPAVAADLLVPKAPAYVAAPGYSWTGFYIGANGGFGGDKFSYPIDGFFSVGPVEAIVQVPFSAKGSVTSSGFFAGGQVGYNHQFSNNVVLGFEADIRWSDIRGEVTFLSDTPPFNFKAGTSLDYFGTVRGRLGYAAGPLLPYVTGGLAYGKITTGMSGVFGIPFSSTTSDTLVGWTVGAGLEYALARNWTFKTEYLYIDLGSSNLLAFSGPDGLTGLNIDVDATFHTIKAGVNYRF